MGEVKLTVAFTTIAPLSNLTKASSRHPTHGGKSVPLAPGGPCVPLAPGVLCVPLSPGVPYDPGGPAGLCWTCSIISVIFMISLIVIIEFFSITEFYRTHKEAFKWASSAFVFVYFSRIWTIFIIDIIIILLSHC